MLCDKTLRLHPKPCMLEGRFLNLLLGSPPVRRQIEMHATGTSGGMKNISQPVIERFVIPLPDPDEQRAIVAVLATHDARLSAEERQLAKLRALKAGLMADLLTGRVAVRPPTVCAAVGTPHT